MSRLILASQSPRRQQLLTEAGYEFEVILPSELAECGICSRETPPELVARLACQKAADVVARIKGQSDFVPADTIVIGCDTVAECCGRILGKPEHRAHAEQMLRLLSGRVHSVYSGLCLWRLDQPAPHVKVTVTRLQMDALQEEQLQEYLDSELWQGKAGAFGYQDRHGWLHITSGSESNVVGLPLELFAEMLALQ